MRFIACSAAHSAVFRVPAPHQNPLAQALGVRLDPEQPRRVGKHRPGVRLGEPLAVEDLEKEPRVLASHVGVVGALGWDVAEVAVPVDDLFRGTTANAEL